MIKRIENKLVLMMLESGIVFLNKVEIHGNLARWILVCIKEGYGRFIKKKKVLFK